MPWYSIIGSELLVKVRVQPRASRCDLVALPDGRLKLRLTAPPADGKANRQAREILAGLFSVPRTRVLLTSGARSRDKTFKISGIGSTAGLPDPESLPPDCVKL